MRFVRPHNIMAENSLKSIANPCFKWVTVHYQNRKHLISKQCQDSHTRLYLSVLPSCPEAPLGSLHQGTAQMCSSEAMLKQEKAQLPPGTQTDAELRFLTCTISSVPNRILPFKGLTWEKESYGCLPVK